MLRRAVDTTVWIQGGCRLPVNKILEDLDSDINMIASNKVPRNVIRPGTLAFEIDELAQSTRIKLWGELVKGQVRNPRALAYCITGTKAIDMARSARKVPALSIDDSDSLKFVESKMEATARIQDPAVKYEEKEKATGLAEAMAKAVLRLPARQQYAMLCFLNEEAIDIHPLPEVFLKHGLDIEATCWPEEKEERQRLRASFTIARKKLQNYLKHLYPRV